MARVSQGCDAVRSKVALTKVERVRKYGEVFTPDWMVKRMCDELPEDAFQPEKTFLEPACGDGAFLVEILRRKFDHCRTRADYSVSLRSVYGMEIQADNVQKSIERVTELCREYFNPSKDDLQVINDHVILCDSLKVMRMMHDPQLQEDHGRTGEHHGD